MSSTRLVEFVSAPADASPVLLIGAAHVVDLSASLRALLTDRALDGIAIELDAERAQSLFGPGGPSRHARGPLFARLWSILQRRLGSEIGGGLPGAEMRTALAVAHERGLPLFLIDDPIRQTLLELVRSMPLKERVALLVGSFLGLFVPSRVVVAEMERYVVSPQDYVNELRQASPTMARVLLDERNEHMAERILGVRSRGVHRLAVVVGDAHVAGLGAALARRGIAIESIPFETLRGLKGPSSTTS